MQKYPEIVTTVAELVMISQNEVVTSGNLFGVILHYVQRGDNQYPLWATNDNRDAVTFVALRRTEQSEVAALYSAQILYKETIGYMCVLRADGQALGSVLVNRTSMFVDIGCNGEVDVYEWGENNRIDPSSIEQNAYVQLTGPVYDYYLFVLQRQRSYS